MYDPYTCGNSPQCDWGFTDSLHCVDVQITAPDAGGLISFHTGLMIMN